MTSAQPDKSETLVRSSDGEERSVVERERVSAALERVDRLARLLDDQFRIPGTQIRFGVDPIIGIIPGGGDWVAWVAGVYVIVEAIRLDLPTLLIVRMSGNTIVDLVGGYVPVVGDLFDAAYRSNRRNVDLMFDHFAYEPGDDGRRQLPDTLPDRSGSAWLRYLAGAGLIGVLTLFGVLPILIIWWLFGG